MAKFKHWIGMTRLTSKIRIMIRLVLFSFLIIILTYIFYFENDAKIHKHNSEVEDEFTNVKISKELVLQELVSIKITLQENKYDPEGFGVAAYEDTCVCDRLKLEKSQEHVSIQLNAVFN